MAVGVENIARDSMSMFEAWRRPSYQTIRQFACEEIIIPSGEYEGSRFRIERQPFTGLWFDAINDPSFMECVITGPSQSGKTLIGFVIPVLYHLFERNQDVIAAVPDFDMVRDKWSSDILPALERTRYRDLVPQGNVSARQSLIEFGNGASLRWMTAGGSDKSRAGYTAHVICMTETDGFDTRMSTSDEADKIKQIEARMRSVGLLKRRIYKECTVSVEDGHTWRRYQAGTASRIMVPCPHCQGWVQLERDDFTGWQGANSDVEAVQGAAFFCNQCGEAWSENDRRQANAKNKLVHRGQQIEDGEITGTRVKSFTLGFRWSAVNNLLVPAHDLAVDEWEAARSPNEDNEERKLSQFVWCVPYVPKDLEEIPLTVEAIQKRSGDDGRGVCPDKTFAVTIGIDVNKPVLHWTAIAWFTVGETFEGRIIDYGKQGIKSLEDGFEASLFFALQKLKGKFGTGWTACPPNTYNYAVIDSRWSTGEVVKCCKQLKDPRWRPFMGLGQGHWKRQTYRHPTKIDKSHLWTGDACYEQIIPTYGPIRFMMADANYWKTWLHSRLIMSPGENKSDGLLTIFATTDDNDRLQFAKQLTAEKESFNFEQGKGLIREWTAIRSSNHWLDSTYMACVAGNRIWYRRKQTEVSNTRPNRDPKPKPAMSLSAGGKMTRARR